MNSSVKAIYFRLLKETAFNTHRYLFSQFNLRSRLTGIIGPRGTGKTTLMIQYIKEKIEDPFSCIYVSADNIYFTNTTLFSFVEEAYEIDGIKCFFFDEIHKYKNWNQELKNIYDSFPDIYIVFSGSSSIDLVHGAYDLSRRGIVYRLNGMSFREYLSFKLNQTLPILSFQEIIKAEDLQIQQIAQIDRIRGHFKEYLHSGYYPFCFEDQFHYHRRIMNIIEKTIYEDISKFYNLKTENLVNFKKILAYLATIPPGKISIHQISKHIGMDHKTVTGYLEIMKVTGLIRVISSFKSGSALLKSTEKIFIENTDIYEAITQDLGHEKSIGTIRELFFIEMIQNADLKIHYSAIGDYEVDGYYFEIGGKNKKKTQIKNYLDRSFLVKDDVLFGEKHVIPLYLFGFLY